MENPGLAGLLITNFAFTAAFLAGALLLIVGAVWLANFFFTLPYRAEPPSFFTKEKTAPLYSFLKKHSRILRWVVLAIFSLLLLFKLGILGFIIIVSFAIFQTKNIKKDPAETPHQNRAFSATLGFFQKYRLWLIWTFAASGSAILTLGAAGFVMMTAVDMLALLLGIIDTIDVSGDDVWARAIWYALFVPWVFFGCALLMKRKFPQLQGKKLFAATVPLCYFVCFCFSLL